MQTVEVPDTSRFVRTYSEGDKVMVIVADQLSDIRVLQQHHITLHGQCKLYVFVNRVLTQDADGMSVCGRTDGWQQAFTHLLQTFHPAAVYIDVVRAESGIQEDWFPMCLQDGSLYWCAWREGGTILVITR